MRIDGKMPAVGLPSEPRSPGETASLPPLPSSPPPPRPMSAILHTGRSASRMSLSSKQGNGSRASDEDGKTSVRVAVRIRPPLRPSDPGFELVPQRFQRSMVHATSSTSLTVDTSQNRKLFVFDRVFGEDVDQSGIWEYLSDSVNSFTQGYNVSVLAYGQSGSGKSYTMGTSDPAEQNDAESMGIIPRAASLLFEKLSEPPPLNRGNSSGLRTPTRYSMASAQGLGSFAKAGVQSERNWQMKATYVEIYNEQLRDLLVPDSVPVSQRAQVTIREDVKGRIILTGLQQVNINSMDDLLGALNTGSAIRQTDSTAINAKSSRSHAVFSINLVQRKNKPQSSARDKRMSMPVEALSGLEEFVTMDSKLHFVDLAGSERLKNTGASGDRVREGISINAGLASLGKVISQLSTRHAGNHISYRDSKLTRLLQDSLGGNAITYMVACVTPAEFHLSETLNTVSYAQKSRAIQSRPQLQQVSDEGDKQAVIDRLRAEISFLRDQIRSSERGGSGVSQEKLDRHNEREMDLQNHLLDIQENYTALSQRHAKLISEITKARDGEPSETPTLTEAIGDSAVERLQRSNSFAEAVEQVVLEYEKTIQSLENSVSNTRSSLATTESVLLEKENKCAYMETLNQQLQSRVQKLIDREASNEHYLHTLETRLDGQVSGDEKTTALVVELRKEISRIRENEAQCEDYISTLEERLAEADQDLELKQRELDRLEHVVERQRSLGKLDNLLYEFDQLQPNGPDRHEEPEKALTNGIPRTSSVDGGQKSILEIAAETAIPDSDDEESAEVPAALPNSTNAGEHEAPSTPAKAGRLTHRSPKQTKSIHKRESSQLEQVTRELLDLRLLHQSTVGEFDMMSAKYEEALRTLAELQDAVDESRHLNHTHMSASPTSHRPTSLLEDARVNDLRDGEPVPSSRSLSSELSLAGDSNTSLEPSADERSHTKTPSGDFKNLSSREDLLLRELEDSRRAQNRNEENLRAANERYSKLQELHSETLDIVEELKTDLSKARLNAPTSPTSPVIRRKSSQNVMTIDRAHRSFASLRNIAAENLEDKKDVMRSFELHLNTAIHELHQRSERVQLIEAEMAALKKEMDSKMHMISGLTRERSSLKTSSPIMDMSVMSQVNDQLLQRESQMRLLQEKFDAREQELVFENENLRKALEDAKLTQPHIPGFFPETPASSLENQEKQLGHEVLPNPETEKLQEEVSQWQNKYQSAMDSMQSSERRLLSTIAELEGSLASVEILKNKAEEEAKESMSKSINETDFENERKSHHELVEALQGEIEGHKSTISSHVDRISALEALQDTIQVETVEAQRSRELYEAELSSHRQRVADLEEQVRESESAVEFHKHGLKSLHDSHSREKDDLRSQIEAYESSRTEMEHNFKTMQDAHTGHVTRLESEVIDTRTQLDKSKENLTNQQQHSKAAILEVERQRDQLQAQISTIKSEMNKAAKLHEANLAKMEEMRREKDRATSLVDQLEDQLNTSYDQQRTSASRLSMLNNTVSSQVHAVHEEKAALEKQLRESQSQVESLHSQLRDSQQALEGTPSSLRKSTSVTSLPSPPPAIPLPPLPAKAVASPTATSFPQNAHAAAASDKLQKDLEALSSVLADRDNHMRQMEKHLIAEKQLTQTLEEALADLEAGQKRSKADVEGWKRKCWGLEDELSKLKKEGGREKERERWSVQAMEEEKGKRREAERARQELEERMRDFEHGKKKKKKGSGLNCF